MRLANLADPDHRLVKAALSSAAPMDAASVSRRRFLQATGAVAGASLLPMWMAEHAAAATPYADSDGILVVVNMSGGCDPLEMVAPINDGSYYDQRGGIALAAASTLPIDGASGLHPALTTVKSMWDTGQVAIIEGVGDPAGNLSHFDMTARMMAGNANLSSQTSGWLGRYLDGLPGPSTFNGVTVGHRVPLVVQGRYKTATTVPESGSGLVVREAVDPWVGRELDAMASFGNGSRPGPWADALGDSSAQAIEVSGKLAPVFASELPEGDLALQMELAARLINANLGVRVFSLDFGDFDGHADHARLHQDGFYEFDDALARFFNTLDRRFADQTMVLTTTEFGRRVNANRSGGTDHGAAATYLAIGSQVNPGRFGARPSLTDLDRHGNLKPQVDFRSVYGTVLTDWLDADQAEVLGANYPNLGFTAGPAQKAVPAAPAVATGLETRDQVFRLYLAYFRRTPETSGIEFWMGQRKSGMSIEDISAAFAGSEEFRSAYGALSNSDFVQLVYNNVLGRNADGDGLTYWSGQLDEGLSRGRVMLGFSDSPEYRSQAASVIAEWDTYGPVARLYQAYFLRAPDTDGLQYWTSTTQPIATISQAFAESPEFATRYGSLSNRAFVELVYENVIGRAGEAEGVNFWTSSLDGGNSRGAVMVGFSESQEFIGRFRALRD